MSGMGVDPDGANTCQVWGRLLEKTNLATAFLLAERFSRSPDPAIECIMGGTDKDQVQSLQVMTGRIRMNSPGVLKSEFAALN